MQTLPCFIFVLMFESLVTRSVYLLEIETYNVYISIVWTASHGKGANE